MPHALFHCTTSNHSSPLLLHNNSTILPKNPSLLVTSPFNSKLYTLKTPQQQQQKSHSNIHCFSPTLLHHNQIDMAQGGVDKPKPMPVASSPYEEAMDALSSLITKRSRADKSNKGGRFDLLFDYLKILDLDEAISEMKIIHVAGTKGKGSTCTFVESILRHCGFRTGLFTSPHLIDVRERFRLNGMNISEENFLEYFWWCYNRLQEKSCEDIPVPTYFRFLALLAFKIFAAEQVDVVILEVGLGGRFDATNVVQNPIVCGISALGYDHMEILGNTLGEIAGEKAGIFKQGIPAFTVPQPDEAMNVLKEKATQLNVELKVVAALDSNLLNGLNLGLEGQHQYQNAGLAVALCYTWLQRTGQVGVTYLGPTEPLPEQFIKGLTTASLQGRAQIVPDPYIENLGNLVFYLDGAHSPESMDICARWFSYAIREENQQQILNKLQDDSRSSNEVVREESYRGSRENSEQILLFNCMSVRDPHLLLPPLVKTCATHGIHFQRALFVPNISVYNKVISHALPPADSQVDLSWQFTLQKVLDNLVKGDKGQDIKNIEAAFDEIKDDTGKNVTNCGNSTIFPSLPSAIAWLRDSVQRNKSVRLQVLVTGSLHLVGDVLRLLKK